MTDEAPKNKDLTFFLIISYLARKLILCVTLSFFEYFV